MFGTGRMGFAGVVPCQEAFRNYGFIVVVCQVDELGCKLLLAVSLSEQLFKPSTPLNSCWWERTRSASTALRVFSATPEKNSER